MTTAIPAHAPVWIEIPVTDKERTQAYYAANGGLV